MSDAENFSDAKRLRFIASWLVDCTTFAYQPDADFLRRIAATLEAMTEALKAWEQWGIRPDVSMRKLDAIDPNWRGEGK